MSLRSAASVSAGLQARHEVLPVLLDRNGGWWLQTGGTPEPQGGERVFLIASPEEAGHLRRLSDASVIARPDVYFPVLHGPHGEDGTIQGLLELSEVAYIGSGVAASAVAMDKQLMKALFAQAGLPQGRYRVVRADGPRDVAGLVDELGLPVFVKPANMGSSVAVTKVKRDAEVEAALEAAFAYDRKALVETAIDARELEVAVLEGAGVEASVPGEIVPDREFYDYDSKYSAESQTQLLIPAPLDSAVAEQARALAVDAFAAVNAGGYARVDMFLERKTDRLLLNEINTIPGFTSISMFPKLWEASGLGYSELLDRLVDLAQRRHAERAALRVDRAG